MTIPLYMHDAYLKEMEATIIDIAKETDSRWLIVLDKTIFYPRGGGQSTDQGNLFSGAWRSNLSQALQKEDKIIHFVEGSEPPPKGTVVKGTLDWDRRYLHMRLHSAGHVIDFAMYLLGLSPTTLMPVKGEHGKKPVIYYQGAVQDDLRGTLEQKANELVTKNLPFSMRFVTYEELERDTIYLQPDLPTNKQLRMLTLEGVGSVADGGTQVHHTAEVGKISILPIEQKDGMTLIHYRLV